ncbi:MAG: radical SAM protein [Spirochaetales bacterium]|nr:radical SAM protein [Spirochaetales bacterium]
MVKPKEKPADRALNPTSIDLGEYVINPYSGCVFGCLYCYVRNNKSVMKRREAWGSYVEARTNIPLLLERELKEKKPGQVLLGSTTECFQPAERKYRLTGQILEILNKLRVKYVIMTRSPMICEYIPLLEKGCCTAIYFTANMFARSLKKKLEPGSPGFRERFKAINRLLEAGLPVIPYFSPLLPSVSLWETAFRNFPAAEKLEMECLNFNLPTIRAIIAAVLSEHPGLKALYEKMAIDASFFIQTWDKIEDDVQTASKKANKQVRFHRHAPGDFYRNTYNAKDA